MTATEKLRRLLDERGVEYRTHGTTDRTWFEVGNISWCVIERENGNLTANAVFLTPEQAIAATLGSCNCSDNCTNSGRTGTCYDTGESRIFHCSECGLGLDDVFIDDEEYYPFADFPRFCPCCGAKVVEPTTNDVGAEVTDGRP